MVSYAKAPLNQLHKLLPLKQVLDRHARSTRHQSHPLNPYVRADAALQFAVTFAVTDLATLTSRQLVTLERHVQALINREAAWSTHQDGELGLAGLRILQAGALDMLKQIIQPTTTGAGAGLTMASGVTLVLIRQDGAFRCEYLGSRLDRLRYHLLDALRDVGPTRLLGCPALTPEGTLCGTPFFKVTQKEFCSARCQSRMYMRALRAKERAGDPRAGKKGRHGKTTR